MKILESDEWRDAMLGWCGMGAAPQRVPAQSSQQFEVYVREAPTRVGLLLLPPHYERGRVYQCEWLPFAVRARLVKWQNQRLDDKLNKKMVWSTRLEPLPPVTMLTTQVTPSHKPGSMP
jgi:hypothetical protein